MNSAQKYFANKMFRAEFFKLLNNLDDAKLQKDASGNKPACLFDLAA